MSRTRLHPLPLAALVSALLPLSAAAQREPTAGVGVAAAFAISGAPLGEIAERQGMVAIPGLETEVRMLRRTASGAEWSLGFIGDSYRVDQEIDRLTNARFEYRSAGVVAGYGRTELEGGVPVHYAIDVGWRRFEASSARPSYYTGEREASRTSGHAALFAASFGIEVPLAAATLVPRARIETSYPDFGGGDGYSALHREHDLGFRASVGIGVKRMLRVGAPQAERAAGGKVQKGT